MSENGNPQMLRTAKIKIAQIKNPNFRHGFFVFQYFRFTRRHLEYIIQTQYIIYINILNRIEADYGKRKGTIRQRNHGYEREFPPMVHRRGA